MPVPPRTPAQRQQALATASRARGVRADIRRQLQAGTLRVRDVLERADEPEVGSMRVVALVEALPGFGPKRTAALLRTLKIAESRRLQGLGPRQIERLLTVLDR